MRLVALGRASPVLGPRSRRAARCGGRAPWGLRPRGSWAGATGEKQSQQRMCNRNEPSWAGRPICPGPKQNGVYGGPVAPAGQPAPGGWCAPCAAGRGARVTLDGGRAVNLPCRSHGGIQGPRTFLSAALKLTLEVLLTGRARPWCCKNTKDPKQPLGRTQLRRDAWSRATSFPCDFWPVRYSALSTVEISLQFPSPDPSSLPHLRSAFLDW